MLIMRRLPMAVTMLTKENFEETVSTSDVPVIVDFYAD